MMGKVGTPRSVCERPGCADPVRHRPHIGGHRIDGWSALCCSHADELMRCAAISVDPAEAAAGWARWRDAHLESCGPEMVA